MNQKSVEINQVFLTDCTVIIMIAYLWASHASFPLWRLGFDLAVAGLGRGSLLGAPLPPGSSLP